MRAMFVLGLLGTIAVAPEARATTLAAGSQHTIVRSADGRVWVWGDNSRGQLGTGDLHASAVPQQLDQLSGVLSVAAGAHHSLALRADGVVLSWGANDVGQLGDGTRTDRPAPVVVDGLPAIVAIAAGADHSLALDADGVIWAWGDNAYGQLGDGTRRARARPLRVAQVRAQQIAAGAHHSLAVDAQGAVWSWGEGAFGIGAQPVPGLPPVAAVSGGNGFSLAVTREGTVLGWGRSDQGQLGVVRARVAVPIRLTIAATVASVAAGDSHALAVTNDGLLVSWGDDAHGQLGREEGTPRAAQVLGLSTIEAAAASFGAHSVAVTTDGVLWAWGANASGQVGDGTAQDRDLPVQITEPGYACLVGTPVLDPPGGAFAGPLRVTVTCATPGAVIHYTTNGSDPSITDPVLASGAAVLVDRSMTIKARAFRQGLPASNVAAGVYSLRSAGSEAGEAAGVIPQAGSEAPPEQAGPSRTLTFATGVLAAGLGHSLVLKSDGTVWAFGANGSGQLGDGTTTQRLYPVQVSGLTGVTAIAAGANHSVALKSDGTVWTWGNGVYGQIGNGGTGNPTTPVQVLTGAVAIAAGANHTLAVKSDGTAWAWGANANGQLGDNSITTRTSPVQVTGLTGAVRVAGGAAHSLALKSDGTVWAWGANNEGQLGDGTTTQRLTAVQVDGASSIVDISAGRSSLWYFGIVSVALRDDGAVLGWGYNSVGEIGDGTSQRRITAVRSLMEGAGAVATGESQSIAAKTDGTLYAWGSNGFGQIGDGTTTNRLSPVAIAAPVNVVAVAGGGSHTLVVTSDGSVWAWGFNNFGQLGDGTTTQRNSPRQIAEAGFTWKVGTPVLSPGTGTYSAAQTVTVTVQTPAVTIHYATNGNEPTEADPTVASGSNLRCQRQPDGRGNEDLRVGRGQPARPLAGQRGRDRTLRLRRPGTTRPEGRRRGDPHVHL